MTVENRSSSQFNHEFKDRPELSDLRFAQCRKSGRESGFLEEHIAIHYVSSHIFRHFFIDEYLRSPIRLRAKNRDWHI